MSDAPSGFSSLLLAEYFAAGDERFLGELLSAKDSGEQASGVLGAYAERWYQDRRPFARRALLAYIDDGCNRWGHRLLVKRLFKFAEAAQDDEALGHFLAAFDSLSTRQLVKGRRWDPQTRQAVEFFALRRDPSVPGRAPRPRTGRNPQTGEPMKLPSRAIDRFSRVTRRYLARRAFRYFRRLGYRDPARYGTAIRRALHCYRDENLSKPENLLDAWGLLHVLYVDSPVLDRQVRGIKVAAGQSLKDLQPAPYFPETWRGCFDELLELCLAPSRPVRLFALALLERDYELELAAIKAPRVRSLLKSPHEEIQLFATKLLRSVNGLESLPISEWLELLTLDNPAALPTLCELVEKHVAPERLTLEQCVALACAKPGPVAALGLRWAQSKQVKSAQELQIAIGLCAAGAPQVRQQATDWLVQLLSASPAATPLHVRELVDARHADVRERAVKLLAAPKFKEETLLWAALAETPYDDVRTHFVAHLRQWEHALGAETLRHVWASALLAIHRGGRAKKLVANQVAARLVARPAEVESLLPLLAIALRSVRASERRTALAAISQAAMRAPSLQKALAVQLPELRLIGGVAA